MNTKHDLNSGIRCQLTVPGLHLQLFRDYVIDKKGGEPTFVSSAVVKKKFVIVPDYVTVMVYNGYRLLSIVCLTEPILVNIRELEIDGAPEVSTHKSTT